MNEQHAPSTANFDDWVRQCMPQIQEALEKTLAHQSVVTKYSQVVQAMHYGVMNGGKRFRAICAIAAGELVGAPNASMMVITSALELLHAYTLVHDDLPCMDNDDMRRGKPSTHIQFDESTALLAGDGLQSLAFETLLSEQLIIMPERRIQLLSVFAKSVGVSGVVGGQAIDCANVGQVLPEEVLRQMHHLKTGVLVACSVQMGALCGTPLTDQQWTSLSAYAKDLGLLFQVVDDILDATSSTAVLGKTAGKDEAQQKPTFLSLYGLEAAKLYAIEIHDRAADQLSCFGQKAARLLDVLAYCLNRTH